MSQTLRSFKYCNVLNIIMIVGRKKIDYNRAENCRWMNPSFFFFFF
jgi:hypothetical protein